MINLPTEAGLKILSSLRGSPMLVALLLINIAVMVMISYLLVISSEQKMKERAQLMSILERCYLRERTP